jgi:arylsulfatase
LWELYDIAADRTELHNLAAKQPSRTQAMASDWEAWAKKALAKPWPYGKKKKPKAKPKK